MLSLWSRLPVSVRAVITGLAVAAADTTPWGHVGTGKSKAPSGIPWAVLPAALYLWLFSRYVRGDWWPRSTAEARRISCRSNPVPGETWGLVLVARGFGLVAPVLMMNAMNRLVTLPAQQTGDLSHVSSITLLGWLLMSAIVAGIAEESAFCGYMEGPIERRHGPVIAYPGDGQLIRLRAFFSS
jgi:membrane protease YdiL (CAAX protease family)